MSITKDLNPTQPSSEPAWDDIESLPVEIYSDEPLLETDLHLRQIMVLIQSLEHLWRDRQDFYATGNLTIYHSPEQIKSRDFRVPDFFVVLNTERKLRKSWVVWAEGGKFPNMIVEVLSDRTAKVDEQQRADRLAAKLRELVIRSDAIELRSHPISYKHLLSHQHRHIFPSGEWCRDNWSELDTITSQPPDITLVHQMYDLIACPDNPNLGPFVLRHGQQFVKFCAHILFPC